MTPCRRGLFLISLRDRVNSARQLSGPMKSTRITTLPCDVQRTLPLWVVDDQLTYHETCVLALVYAARVGCLPLVFWVGCYATALMRKARRYAGSTKRMGHGTSIECEIKALMVPGGPAVVQSDGLRPRVCL